MIVIARLASGHSPRGKSSTRLRALPIAALALGVLCSSGGARAAQITDGAVVIWSNGARSCTDFLLANENEDDAWARSGRQREPNQVYTVAYAVYEGYMAGYLTAASSALKSDMSNISVPAAMIEVANYCNQNPSDYFNKAVTYVVNRNK